MPGTRSLRRAAAALLLTLLALAAYAFWRQEHAPATQGALTLYGNVDIREVQLAFDDQGRIRTLDAVEGQVVHDGETLGTLDDRRYRLAYKQARAQQRQAKAQLETLLAGTRREEIDRLKAEVAAARATLQLREATYRRIDRLTRSQASTPQDLDAARAGYRAAAAQLKSLQASLALALAGPRAETVQAARAGLQAADAAMALASRRLQDTRLVAPTDGIVRTRILEPGDMASPQQPVYTLALTRPLWVRAYVDEPDLGHLHSGERAWVESDSFPGERFEGWVGYISPTAEFTPKTVETAQLRTSLVYQVRIFVCNPHNRLRLGMPATVHLRPEAAPVGAQDTACKQAARS
ncbi:efflux RND transporter periplasmic adaptor subunit [Acidihalobacter prosperus]|uniref:Hemolysin D n=1 Tax=Acidihalobacter prosperus TaxID=160660 RepID=A0A1A6C7H9_9GAMM|nr:efflux RND transporter periplasmic adaptor subunit [Acidihalobacter prosperus]OBS10517.1 hypothetical protein Thpro_020233 [Acidihalobacter prosperus]